MADTASTRKRKLMKSTKDNMAMRILALEGKLETSEAQLKTMTSLAEDQKNTINQVREDCLARLNRAGINAQREAMVCVVQELDCITAQSGAYIEVLDKPARCMMERVQEQLVILREDLAQKYEIYGPGLNYIPKDD